MQTVSHADRVADSRHTPPCHACKIAAPGRVSGWLALCVTTLTLVVSLATAAALPKVARAANESTDLNKFVQNVLINGDDYTGKEFTTLEGDEPTISLVFKETPTLQLDMTEGAELVYTLPANIRVQPREDTVDIEVTYYANQSEQTVTIKNNEYKIADGKITLTWNYADNSETINHLSEAMNAEFQVKFSGEFTGDNGTTEFGNGKDVIVNINKDHNMRLWKSGSYDPNDGKMHYTLTVTSEGNNTGVVVTDAISGTDLKYIQGSVVVKDNSGNEVTGHTLDQSENGFTCAFPSMSNGQQYNILYTADITLSDAVKNGTATVEQTGNTATVKSDQDTEGKNQEVFQSQVTYSTLSKSGTLGADGETITWRIYYNPEGHVSMAGETIKDTLNNPENDQNLQSLTGSATITRYARAENGTSDVTYNHNGTTWLYNQDSDFSDTVALSGTSFEYTIPSGEGNDTPYMYVIEYQSKVDRSNLINDVNVTNTATDGNRTSTPGVTVHPKEEIKLKKQAVSWDDDQIKWEYSFNVPASGLASAVVTDTLPHAEFIYSDWSKTNLFDAILKEEGGELSAITVTDTTETGSSQTIEKDTTAVGVQGYEIVYKDGTDNLPGSTELISGVAADKAPQLVISFYYYIQDGDDTRKVDGFMSGEESHTVTVSFTTENNQQWRKLYGSPDAATGTEITHEHENNVSLRANGYTTTAKASVTIEDSGFYKRVANGGLPAYEITLDGKTYPAWQFMLFIVGQPSEGDLTEYFDTDKFRLVTDADLGSATIYYEWFPISGVVFDGDWGEINGTNVEHYNPKVGHINRLGNVYDGFEGSRVNYTVNDDSEIAADKRGVTFHISSDDIAAAKYGDIYCIQYLLIPKDDALDDILKEGISTAVNFDNSASWNDETSSVGFSYQYNPGVKEISNLMATVKGQLQPGDTEQTVTVDPALGNVVLHNVVRYDLVINPEAEWLGDSDTKEIEAIDTLEGPQSIIYSTIRAEVKDADANTSDVRWDVSGYAITFHVPNGKRVEITYYAHVNADVVGSYSLSNTLQVNGMSTTVGKSVSITKDAIGKASVPTLYVLKYESGSMNHTLTGAIFGLYESREAAEKDTAGTQARTYYSTDENGIATIASTATDPIFEYSEEYPITYYLRETTAPQGYEADPTIYEFRIGTSSVPDYRNYIYVSGEQIRVPNKRATKGTLEIVKTINGATLTDAQKASITFTVVGTDGDNNTIYNKSFNLANKYADSDEHEQFVDGRLTLTDLTPGTYTVTETVGADGEVPGYECKTTYTVTDSDGEAGSSSDNPGPAEVVAGKTTSVEVTNTYEEKQEDAYEYGSVTITKNDQDGTALAGATFGLYRVDSAEAAATAAENGDTASRIATYTSASDGTFTINTAAWADDKTDVLPIVGTPVTYYLVETEAPAGYTKSSTVHEVVISATKSDTGEFDATKSAFVYTTTYSITIDDANDGITISNTENREDDYRHNSVTLTKVDAATGDPLNNATFTLYQDADCKTEIGSYPVNASGQITIGTQALWDSWLRSVLPAQAADASKSVTVYLKETTTPPGYEGSDEVIELTITASTEKGNLNTDRTAFVYTTTYTIAINDRPEVVTGYDADAGTANITNEALNGEIRLTKVVTIDNTSTNGSKLADGDYTITVTGPGEVDEAYRVTKTVVFTIKNGVVESAKDTSGTEETSLDVDTNGYVTLTGLTPGEYTIDETPRTNSYATLASISNNGKVTVEPGGTGDAAAVATVTNNVPTSSLTLTKLLDSDRTADASTEFTFTVKLTNANGSAFTNTSGIVGMNFDANGVATVKLTKDQEATASGLPVGVRYEITEASVEGFSLTGVTVNKEDKGNSATVSGAIANTDTSVVYTNRRETGGFTVKKTVTGPVISSDPTEFTFTVTLSDTSIGGETGKTYGEMEFKNGVATFTLTNDADKKAEGLPAGITYTVTETAATGFSTSWSTEASDSSVDVSGTNAVGTIVANENPTVVATNTRNTGSLTLTKRTVNPEIAHQGDEFIFTVTLYKANGTETDTSIRGEFSATKVPSTESSYPTVTFTNGVSNEIKLKGGESLTINGLPAGVSYGVEEKTADGYVTSYSSAKGVIAADNTVEATVTNVRDAGGLMVTKTVASVDNADKDAMFTFTLTLKTSSGSPASTDTSFAGVVRVPNHGSSANKYEYISFDDNGQATFKLKSGEEAVVVERGETSDKDVIDTAVPEGFTYTVTEESAGDGYSASSSGATGSIVKDKTSLASFTNTRTGSLRLAKEVTVNGKPTSGTLADGTYTFEVEGPGDYKKIVEITIISGVMASAKVGNETVTLVTDGGKKYVELTGLTPGSYTVKETDGNNTDVSLDETQHKVEVAAGANGSLARTVTITNNRGSGNLTVTKKLSGLVLPGDNATEFSFMVTLSDTSINGKFDDMTFANGVAEFTLANNETKVATGLPVGVGYTVEEIGLDSSYELTSRTLNEQTVSSSDAKVTGTITSSNSAVVYTNERVTGDLSVKKAVESATDADKSKPYTFTITLYTNEEMTTVANNVTGTFGNYGALGDEANSHTLSFSGGSATFTLSNDQTASVSGLPVGLYYKVQETTPAGFATIWTQGQISGEDAQKGQISSTVTPTITATNHAPGSLLISKAVTLEGETGADGADVSKLNGTYEFTVTGPGANSPVLLASATETKVTITIVDGEIVSGTVNGANATLVDGSGGKKYVEVPNLKPGYYTVAEDVPANGSTLTRIDGGYNNAKPEEVSTRSVTALVAAGKVGSAVGTQGSVTFTNNAQAGVGPLRLTKHVTIDGQAIGDGTPNPALADGAYTFTVTGPADGAGAESGERTVVVTITNGKPSAATIDGEPASLDSNGFVVVTGLKVGTYEVKETSYTGPNPFATIDHNTYKVTVIEDAVGDAVPKVEITNNVDTGSLTVHKTVEGDTTGDADNEFGFTVRLTNGTGITGTFGGMSFVSGVATFTLKAGETITAAGLPAGVTYTVSETTIPNGYATSAHTTGALGTIAAGATKTADMVNVYAPETSVTLVATKTLDGAELTAGQFSFELVDAKGNVIQTATNAADGSVTFGAIGYTVEDAGETYVYTMREVIPTGVTHNADGTYTMDGITYDTHEVKVTVVVADDGHGVLTATASYEGERPVFANTFTPETPTPTPETPAPHGAIPRTGDTMPVGVPPLLLAAGLALASVGYLLKRRKEIRPHGAHMRR